MISLWVNPAVNLSFWDIYYSNFDEDLDFEAAYDSAVLHILNYVDKITSCSISIGVSAKGVGLVVMSDVLAEVLWTLQTAVYTYGFISRL